MTVCVYVCTLRIAECVSMVYYIQGKNGTEPNIISQNEANLLWK